MQFFCSASDGFPSPRLTVSRSRQAVGGDELIDGVVAYVVIGVVVATVVNDAAVAIAEVVVGSAASLVTAFLIFPPATGRLL